MLVLGIDIGTSSLKVGAAEVGSKGLVDWSREDYALQHPQPGWAELDANLYWNAWVGSLARLKIDRRQVRAIAISSQSQSFVPVDRQGQPLQNAWTWIDSRATAEASQLNRFFPRETLRTTTGVPEITPGSFAAMVKYLKDHDPQLLGRAWKLLLSNSYLFWRLGGEAVLDANVAAMTGLYDWHRNTWWSEMLAAVGIEEALLPKVYPCGSVIGKILPAVADELGLSRDVLLVTGANDQTANALGAGLLNEQNALIVLGTALVIFQILGRDQRPAQAGNPGFCGPYPVPGTSYQLGYTNSGCGMLDWAKQLLAPEIPFSQLDSKLARVPIGSNGATWLIDLDGVAWPADKHTLGTLAGVSRKTDRWTLLRAVFEGVACSVQELAEQLGFNLVGKDVRIVGGGAGSDLWVQMHANLLNVPVSRLSHDQSGVLGSCIMAAKGTGMFKTYEEAVGAWVHVARRFTPQPSDVRRYKDVYHRFGCLRKAGNQYYSNAAT